MRRPAVSVPGTDVAGEVVVGAGPWKAGDAVLGATTLGAWADLVEVPVDMVVRKPDNLSWEEAGALAVSGHTALHALNAGRMKSGMRVLVLGASGGVGHMAVQLARVMGASNITAVCSKAKAGFVRELGVVDDVLDYAEPATQAKLEAARFDLVVVTAGQRSMAELAKYLSPGGIATVVGGEDGNALTGGFVERMVAGLLATWTSSEQKRFEVVMTQVTPTGLNELMGWVAKGRGLVRPRVTITHH